jgi:hypothetical protein
VVGTSQPPPEAGHIHQSAQQAVHQVRRLNS